MTENECLAKAAHFDQLADNGIRPAYNRNQAGIWRQNAARAAQLPVSQANDSAWATHVKAGGD